MTATRSARQRGIRRLTAATAGLVAAAGAGVAVLAVHDSSTAHASTTKPTNSGSRGTDQSSVGSGSGSGSSLSAPETQPGGSSGGSSSSSSSDATSGGS